MPAHGVFYNILRKYLPALKTEPPLPHPIDKFYGIDTSGSLFGPALQSGKLSADAYITGYAGSQPSIVRKILQLIPNLENTTFLDLGCGKGRALAIASEYPFRDIIGIEISRKLAETARANAQIIGSRFPERTPITVLEGDAANIMLPEGRVIVFLYNPFYKPLMKKLVANIHRALTANPKKKIFIVYANPLYAALFDKSPFFRRFFAADIAYDASEQGTGTTRSDKDDTIVIWESVGDDMLPPHPGADASVFLTEAGWRARVSRPTNNQKSD